MRPERILEYFFLAGRYYNRSRKRNFLLKANTVVDSSRFRAKIYTYRSRIHIENVHTFRIGNIVPTHATNKPIPSILSSVTCFRYMLY